MAKTGGRVAVPEEEKRARGARLRALREHLKLSQDAIAEAGGFGDRSEISKFEGGHRLSSGDVREKLAIAFGVSTETMKRYILGESTLAQLVARRAGPTIEREERYAAMPAVRGMALAQGFDPAFVSSWEAQLDADEQPDAEYLWTLMKASWARHQRKAPAAGDPLAGLDD